MFRTVFVVAALSAGLWVASARAQGTPFGGDDGGFIPQPVNAKCEAGAAKLAGKLAACILKCHAGRASGKFADATAEEACENGSNGSNAVRNPCIQIIMGNPLLNLFRHNRGCPACLEDKSLGTNLFTLTRRLAFGTDDAGWSPLNSMIYCDTSSGTPFGGDDTGFVPTPKSASATCEAGVTKAEIKLVACLMKCHVSRASGILADETAEEACETDLAGKSCFATFNGAIAKLGVLGGCPPCINGTTMASLAGLSESLIDGSYAPAAYCASPSGAFVQ
jgi:hypothetical protein